MFAWGIGAKTEGDAPRKVRIINCNSMAGKKGGEKGEGNAVGFLGRLNF